MPEAVNSRDSWQAAKRRAEKPGRRLTEPLRFNLAMGYSPWVERLNLGE
jgi:hypothetical protein